MKLFHPAVCCLILPLAATACGAPGTSPQGQVRSSAVNGVNGARGGSARYPTLLLGTWAAASGSAVWFDEFSSDGTCVHKDDGVPADPCRYSVTTGGVNTPSDSQGWIVQASSNDGYAASLDVIAIDSTVMTVRDGQKLVTYSHVSDDNLKDCVGPDPQMDCDALATEQSCNDVPGCNWNAYCGASTSCRLEFAQEDCENAPGCEWDFDSCDVSVVCFDASNEQDCSGFSSSNGCVWQGECSGEATSCLQLSADDCSRYPQCHLQ